MVPPLKKRSENMMNDLCTLNFLSCSKGDDSNTTQYLSDGWSVDDCHFEWGAVGGCNAVLKNNNGDPADGNYYFQNASQQFDPRNAVKCTSKDGCSDMIKSVTLSGETLEWE